MWYVLLLLPPLTTQSHHGPEGGVEYKTDHGGSWRLCLLPFRVNDSLGPLSLSLLLSSVDFPSALACRVVLTTTMTAVVAMMIWTRSIDRSTGGPQSNIPSWIAVETASGATENMTSTMG